MSVFNSRILAQLPSGTSCLALRSKPLHNQRILRLELLPSRSFTSIPPRLATSTTTTKPRPVVNLSQTQAPPAKASNASSKSVTSSIDPTVNPPETTRPASLEVPKREEGVPTYKHYFRVGKTYFTFYKRGIKGIWTNRKAAAAIKKRMKADQRKLAEAAKSHGGQVPPHAPLFNRSEFQIMRRSTHDMSRLPVFGLMFAVFGEFLPLVMALLKNRITPVLPHTVRLPSQLEGLRLKEFEHRNAVQEKWGVEPDKLDVNQFALFSAEYYNLGPIGLPKALVPKVAIPRYSRVYYEYLLWDDMLLGANGVSGLVEEEVVIATFERGLWDPNASNDELRKRLEKAVRASHKVEPLS